MSGGLRLVSVAKRMFWLPAAKIINVDAINLPPCVAFDSALALDFEVEVEEGYAPLVPRTFERPAAACSRRECANDGLGGSSFARRSLRQEERDPHQIIGEHSSSDPELEALIALGETPLHATTAEQHGDAALDAGAKALPFFEGGTLLEGFALGGPLAAALRDGHDGDAGLLAPRHILLTEEAAIGTIHFRGMAEGFHVAFQGGLHMLLMLKGFP